MDIISFNEAATANGRIESFIENPDSDSGLISLPKKISVGESVTIPDGRVVVHPNLEIDGTLTIEDGGELFVPFGGTLVSSDLVHPVDTIADLRNVTGKYKYVYVTGYHTKNDGAFGSHIFRLKGVKTTETDNGGTVIVATIGGTDYVYELQFDGAVNVKWFGAGEDRIDNETPITAALALNENLFFPPGTYRISNEIMLENSLLNIEIVGSGKATAGYTYTNTVNITYVGAADDSASIFRAKGSSTIGFDGCTIRNITFDANLLVGSCFVQEGSSGSTYGSKFNFYNCIFSKSTRIGVLIGDVNGVVDVDSYQTNFYACKWSLNPIQLYANAYNNYGPYINRGYFVASFQSTNKDKTFQHIRIDKMGDFRCENTFFGRLQPSTTVTNPITNTQITDEDVVCVYSKVSGAIVNCHTEEARVFRRESVGAAFNDFVIDNLSVNDSRDSDDEGRNLNWNNGASSYSVVNNSKLTIRNSNFGAATGKAGGYRRIYNNGTLSIQCGTQDTSFLGGFGIVEHGSNSNITDVDGVSPSNLDAPANLFFNYWRTDNALYNGFGNIGFGSTASLTASTSNVNFGRYTAKVDITAPATSYTAGLYVTSQSRLPTAKYITLVVAGYADTWLGLKCYSGTSGFTPIGTTNGNINVNYDATTKRFIGYVKYEVDNSILTGERIISYVGLPTGVTGIYYYDVLGFIPGRWDNARISAMLPFVSDINAKLHIYGESSPTTSTNYGNWFKGDIINNSNPSSGGNIGWVCTTAGTPGTWKTFGTISA